MRILIFIIRLRLGRSWIPHWRDSYSEKLLRYLTLEAPTPQNCQIHSINSLTAADELFEHVWPFYRVAT